MTNEERAAKQVAFALGQPVEITYRGFGGGMYLCRETWQRLPDGNIRVVGRPIEGPSQEPYDPIVVDEASLRLWGTDQNVPDWGYAVDMLLPTLEEE